jgi:hypothetical protein
VVDARARAAEDRARVALHVAVTDNEGLYAFVINRLTQRPEVADVRTSVYEHLRNLHIQPADDRAGLPRSGDVDIGDGSSCRG